MIRRRLRNAVLVLFVPHAFRHGHTHGTFAGRRGWLGHAGIAITAAHYAAVVPLRREAAAAMDRALGNG